VTGQHSAEVLPGTERQPHAQAVLGGALRSGRPAHAYLFHGPPGTGKRAAARSFAAALLAERPAAGDDRLGVAAKAGGDALLGRVERGSHPDLTWVRPSGASELLVGDIDAAIVRAASRTPFEASRRVFVIEGADRMNDAAANRLLKTLEEPPPWAHLLLIASERDAVAPTVVSRCQPVRFAPLPAEALAQALQQRGLERTAALACARLALGDAQLADALASDAGRALRACAEELVGALAAGHTEDRPWSPLLERAREDGKRAADAVRAEAAARGELLPERERRASARESADAERRAERRGRAGTLDLGLRLAELWLRDAWCLALGAHAAVHAVDRVPHLQALLAVVPGAAARPRGMPGGAASKLRQCVELVAQTRMRLPLNVSEELALEALCYRVAAVLGR
jgi:DNA polymerase-3 subunit delta'